MALVAYIAGHICNPGYHVLSGGTRVCVRVETARYRIIAETTAVSAAVVARHHVTGPTRALYSCRQSRIKRKR